MEYQIEADWIINNKCNYDCDYCIAHSDKFEQNEALLTPEEILTFLASSRKKWLIHFTGGEPFLYPRFVELCTALSNEHLIALNTNFSTRNVEEFRRLIPAEKVKYINCGFHPQFRQVRETTKALIEKLSLFWESGFFVFSSCVMSPTTLGKFSEYFEIFSENNLLLVPKLLRGSYLNKRYPEEYTLKQIEIIKENYDKASVFISNNGLDEKMARITFNPMLDRDFTDGFPDFTGINCRSGINFVRIKPDGNIYRCGTNHLIGNINRGDIEFFTLPRKCDEMCCPYICLKHAIFPKNESVNLPKRFFTEVKG